MNDNAPVFDSPTVKLLVSENTQVREQIYATKATDQDDPRANGRVRYRMLTNPGARFVVNPDSGDISLLKPLDFEVDKSFTFEIEAFDDGIPSQTAKQTIEIEIQDYNDNAPSFDQDIYRVSVNEAANVLEPVVTIHASDKDSGTNSELIYEILGPTADMHMFGIYSDSGIVYIRRSLDREQRDSYRLQVTVRDNGQPSLSDDATILIQVRFILFFGDEGGGGGRARSLLRPPKSKRFGCFRSAFTGGKPLCRLRVRSPWETTPFGLTFEPKHF